MEINPRTKHFRCAWVSHTNGIGLACRLKDPLFHKLSTFPASVAEISPLNAPLPAIGTGDPRRIGTGHGRIAVGGGFRFFLEKRGLEDHD